MNLDEPTNETVQTGELIADLRRPTSLDDIYSRAVLKKAGDLVHVAEADPEVILRPEPGGPQRWNVLGSGGRYYVVSVIEPGTDEDGEPVDPGIPFVVCTCPNGTARGGRPSCYHTAAVLLILSEPEREERIEQLSIQLNPNRAGERRAPVYGSRDEDGM